MSEKKTKRYSAVWFGQVRRVMVGQVPIEVIEEGNDAILNWLWCEGEQLEDESAGWEPPFEPELDEEE